MKACLAILSIMLIGFIPAYAECHDCYEFEPISDWKQTITISTWVTENTEKDAILQNAAIQTDIHYLFNDMHLYEITSMELKKKGYTVFTKYAGFMDPDIAEYRLLKYNREHSPGVNIKLSSQDTTNMYIALFISVIFGITAIIMFFTIDKDNAWWLLWFPFLIVTISASMAVITYHVPTFYPI